MDDILPLTIYVVSQAQHPFIVSEFKMLEDYIKIAEMQGCKRSGSINFELEKKILTNYNCGVIYVSSEWKAPEASPLPMLTKKDVGKENANLQVFASESTQ